MLQNMLGKVVEVKLRNKDAVRGVLINIDKSTRHDAPLGNVVVQSDVGQLIILRAPEIVSITTEPESGLICDLAEFENPSHTPICRIDGAVCGAPKQDLQHHFCGKVVIATAIIEV